MFIPTHQTTDFNTSQRVSIAKYLQIIYRPSELLKLCLTLFIFHEFSLSLYHIFQIVSISCKMIFLFSVVEYL